MEMDNMLYQLRTRETLTGQMEILKEKVNEVNLGSIDNPSDVIFFIYEGNKK